MTTGLRGIHVHNSIVIFGGVGLWIFTLFWQFSQNMMGPDKKSQQVSYKIFIFTIYQNYILAPMQCKYVHDLC